MGFAGFYTDTAEKRTNSGDGNGSRRFKCVRLRRREAMPAAHQGGDKYYAFALAVSSIPRAFMTASVVLSVGFPRSLNER